MNGITVVSRLRAAREPRGRDGAPVARRGERAGERRAPDAVHGGGPELLRERTRRVARDPLAVDHLARPELAQPVRRVRLARRRVHRVAVGGAASRPRTSRRRRSHRSRAPARRRASARVARARGCSRLRCSRRCRGSSSRAARARRAAAPPSRRDARPLGETAVVRDPEIVAVRDHRVALGEARVARLAHDADVVDAEHERRRCGRPCRRAARRGRPCS